MQWHWGNIGSAAAGLSTLTVAGRLLWLTPDWYRTWKERQLAERDAAREQAKQIRLDRRRRLEGWSAHGIDSYSVVLVTSPQEMDHPKAELLAGNVPSDYVILKAVGSSERYGNAEPARSLRQLIETEGCVARPPTAGEREALEAGLEALGTRRAAFDG